MGEREGKRGARCVLGVCTTEGVVGGEDGVQCVRGVSADGLTESAREAVYNAVALFRPEDQVFDERQIQEQVALLQCDRLRRAHTAASAGDNSVCVRLTGTSDEFLALLVEKHARLIMMFDGGEGDGDDACDEVSAEFELRWAAEGSDEDNSEEGAVEGSDLLTDAGRVVRVLWDARDEAAWATQTLGEESAARLLRENLIRTVLERTSLGSANDEDLLTSLDWQLMTAVDVDQLVADEQTRTCATTLTNTGWRIVLVPAVAGASRELVIQWLRETVWPAPGFAAVVLVTADTHLAHTFSQLPEMDMWNCVVLHPVKDELTGTMCRGPLFPQGRAGAIDACEAEGAGESKQEYHPQPESNTAVDTDDDDNDDDDDDSSPADNDDDDDKEEEEEEEADDNGVGVGDVLAAMPDEVYDWELPETRYRTVAGQAVLVQVVEGDMLREPTQAIVNPANERLEHRGGLASIIADAAGYPMLAECARIPTLPRSDAKVATGSAVSTTAGNLAGPSGLRSTVIHAVGPIWQPYEAHQCREQLRRVAFSCMQEASRLHLTSISIPSISSGIFGAPMEEVARTLMDGVREFLDRHSRSDCEHRTNTVHLVRFLDVSLPKVRQFAYALSALQQSVTAAATDIGSSAVPAGSSPHGELCTDNGRAAAQSGIEEEEQQGHADEDGESSGGSNTPHAVEPSAALPVAEPCAPGTAVSFSAPSALPPTIVDGETIEVVAAPADASVSYWGPGPAVWEWRSDAKIGDPHEDETVSQAQWHPYAARCSHIIERSFQAWRTDDTRGVSEPVHSEPFVYEVIFSDECHIQRNTHERFANSRRRVRRQAAGPLPSDTHDPSTADTLQYSVSATAPLVPTGATTESEGEGQEDM